MKINIIKIHTKNTHFISFHLLGINFNAARESSAALSHIFGALSSSGKDIIKKDIKKQLCHIFLEFCILYLKTPMSCFITHFLSLI